MKKNSDQEIRQAFFDLAHEMEQECDEWWNEPDNPELTARILAAAKELEEKKSSRKR